MNRPQGVDLVERARALAPLITAEADEIERMRRLTPSVTAARWRFGRHFDFESELFVGRQRFKRVLRTVWAMS